jgi:hypothetical protein
MGSTQLLALSPGCTGKVRTDIEKLYSELERVAHAVEKLHGYAISLCEGPSDISLEFGESGESESGSIQHSA